MVICLCLALLFSLSNANSRFGKSLIFFFGAYSRPISEMSAHGHKLLGSGKYLEALREFDKGVEAYPLSASLALSRANTLATLQRYDEALTAYENVLYVSDQSSVPDWKIRAQALTWLGVTNRRLNRKKEAIKWLKESVHYHPTHENRHHLAISLAMDVQFNAAAEELVRAMTLQTADTDFQLLATLLSAAQDWPLMERVLELCLREVCTLAQKTHPKWKILLEYGIALEKNNKTDEAQLQFKEAHVLSGLDIPTFRAAVRKYVQTAEQNHQSVYQNPEHPLSASELVVQKERLREMLEPLLSKTKNPADVIQSRYVHGHLWPIPKALAQSARDVIEAQKSIFAHDPNSSELAHIVRPFQCLMIPTFSLADCIFAAKVRTHRLYNALKEGSSSFLTPNFNRSIYGALDNDNRLHVALFSSDIRPHPMLPLLRGFLMFAPKDLVKITLFHTRADPETLTELLPFVEKSFNVESGSQEHVTRAVNYAREVKVQVWLESSGDTGFGIPTLAASRPAPIGVLWAGFPGSLADPAMQYIMADRFSITENEAKLYPEKVINLPGTWLVNALSVPEMGFNASTGDEFTREKLRNQHGIPLDAVVYANFGRSWKIDDEILSTWCEIIDRVPNSYLVILNYRLSESDQPELIENLRKAFESSGLAPNRLITLSPFRRGDHLIALGALSDVALDTTLYGGGMTALEALKAGIPLISMLAGDKLMQRAGGSVLTAADLSDDLIALSKDHYIEIAIRLALDEKFRGRVQRKVEFANKGIGDAVVFRPEVGARAMVNGLRQAYSTWQRGEAPKSIYVDEERFFSLSDEKKAEKLVSEEKPRLQDMELLDVTSLSGWNKDW